VKKKIFRNYLELKSFKDFKEVKKPSEDYSVELVDPKDFQLNKFFYKNIGKNCHWVDRLVWTELDWTKYISDKKISTYVLKNKDEMAGYFELLFHKDTKEAEIAYFGILEEYFGRKLGGYLLSEAIKLSFKLDCIRVWVHTCSLDHKNALFNYQSRGMKIFKSEILTR
jgi:ribosomal protein S18 acetylase RimI-like enzyme|tara:strand:- start:602 stop:1105 length:504 start_codon:yes stop_codon:yes gene_type:complete